MPYHISGVKSNDELFADDNFKSKVVESIEECLQQISNAQSEIKLKIGSDVYTNGKMIQVSGHCILTLMQYFKPNSRICAIIKLFLDIIYLKLVDLNKDKIGKIQIGN